MLTLQLYGNVVEMAAYVQSVDTKPILSYHVVWVRGYLKWLIGKATTGTAVLTVMNR